MFSLLKFAITFSVSFLLLSIPVQRKPLFYYLNDWASPVTKEIFTGSRSVLLDGVKKGKKIGSKLFNNTIPEGDNLSLQSSSVDRQKVKKEIIQHPDYTDEEKDMLSKILIQNSSN